MHNIACLPRHCRVKPWQFQQLRASPSVLAPSQVEETICTKDRCDNSVNPHFCCHQSVQLPLGEHSNHLPLLGSSCMICILGKEVGSPSYLPLLLRLCCFSAFLACTRCAQDSHRSFGVYYCGVLDSTGQCLQTQPTVCVCVCVKKKLAIFQHLPRISPKQ